MTRFFKGWFRSLISRRFYRSGLLLFAAISSFCALVLPIALRPSSYPLEVGSVSSNDITAPSNATYDSAILTTKAQDAASSAVTPIYLPSNPSIARTQIDSLRVVLNYIDSVRADALSTQEQKKADLSSISAVMLSDESQTLILTLPDNDWATIEKESLSILEQIMRENIRDYQIDESKNSVPNLISLSFSDEESALIQELIDPFITANSLFSEDKTKAAQQAAIASVGTIKSSYIEGQTIVSRGQIISPEQYEALEFFGFVKPQNRISEIISPLLIVALLTGFIALYFSRRKIYPLSDLRSITFITLTYVFFLFSARAVIPNRAILPYLFPIPAFAMMLATLFNLEISLITSLVLSILAAYGLSSASELTMFYLFSSLIGSLILGKGRRVSSFFWAGILSATTGVLVILAYRFLENTTDLLGLLTLIGVTFLNGIASASLALLFQFLASQLLGLTTPLNLLEISRPDNPLLQYILQNAPGTYQHSLQVSNLAEQGAKAIGADALVTRVGALYHDCGKAVNASFFIENQVPGKINPHDDMDPGEAAQTIIEHVQDGIKLADKNHLPPRLKDFIREHHGTALTRYQYCRALDKRNGDKTQLEESLFHYPGPKPRSKETAILMLADGCEARARAELPKTDEELKTLIKKVVDSCMQQGQLDDSNLTLRDLKMISEAFFVVMFNTHHPRLIYPESVPVVENIVEKLP